MKVLKRRDAPYLVGGGRERRANSTLSIAISYFDQLINELIKLINYGFRFQRVETQERQQVPRPAAEVFPF